MDTTHYRSLYGSLVLNPAYAATVKAWRGSDGQTKLKLPFHRLNRDWVTTAFSGALDWDPDEGAWVGITDIKTFGIALRHLRYLYAGMTYIAADGDTSELEAFAKTWTRINREELSNGTTRTEYTVQ